MSEELGFIETGGSSEGGSEVSQEALERVRDHAKAAAGMRAQIVQSGKKNRQYAKLLSLLLMYVEDEKLLHIIFEQLVDKKVPVEVIVGEFLPYLHQRVDVSPLKPIYESVRENATTPWLSKKELEGYYQDVWGLFGVSFDTEKVHELVIMMTKELRIPVEDKLTNDEK